MHRSLAFYIIGVIVLLVLITSGTYYFMYSSDHEEIIQIQINARDQDMRFVINSLLRREAERIEGLLVSLMEHDNLMVQLAVSSSSDAYIGPIASLVSQTARNVRLDYFEVVDENGGIVYSLNNPSYRGQMADWRIAPGEKPRVEVVQVGSKWVIRGMSPMSLGNVSIGSIAIGTWFDDSMASMVAASTDTSVTIGTRDKIVATSISNDQLDAIDHQYFTQSLDGMKAVTQTLEGSDRIIRYAPLKFLGEVFVLAIEYDTSEFVALHRERNSVHMQVLMVSMIASILLGVALTYYLVLPLRRLKLRAAESTREISGGEELDEDDQMDEVRSLVRSFDFMETTVRNHLRQRERDEQRLRKAYNLNREMLQKAPFGIFLIDSDGSVQYVNKAMLEISGTTESMFTGLNLLALPTYKSAGLDEKIRGAIAGEPFTTEEIRYVSYLGKKETIRRFTGMPFEQDDRRHALVFVEDLTNLKEAERKLSQAEQDWANTFNSISDMITIQDIDFNIIGANDAAQKILEVPLFKGRSGKCFEMFHGKNSPPKGCVSCDSLASGRASTHEIYEPHLGMFLEIRAIPRFDSDNKVSGIIHIVRDITERKRLEEELRHHALNDSLTGLPNRVLLMDRMRNLFDHRLRDNSLLFAVLFLDLDHFKKINDSYGHVAGDELLRKASERVLDCTRPGDTVSRFGGDEFVVLLDGINEKDDAVDVAHRISEALRRPFDISGNEVFISASVGIAVCSEECQSPELLLRDADTAMYQAKNNGRACHIMFDTKMHADTICSLEMENDLRRALEKNELKLYYQPIVNLESGEISGFEALMRWERPHYGVVMPKEFIPMAEDTGIINIIGDWAINDACAQIKRWQDEFPRTPPLSVSVNLSPRQFTHRLSEVVESALERNGIASSSLRLEITETILMENSDLALKLLNRFRDVGVQVYLDDFGTGYSSLNYIHKFPVSALKIDRTFVQNIREDRDAQEIVKAIAALANNLGMIMIVEGVEELGQLELFRTLKCKYTQGYLFSKPLPSAEAEMYIRSVL